MSGKQAKKKRRADREYSRLEQHVRSGTTLTPPLLSLPNLKNCSWMNDRLPDLLWAVLLATQLERKTALEIFRSTASVGLNYRGMGTISITLSGIASMPQDARDAVINAITADQSCREILKWMLVFKDLPARDSWLARLEEPKPPYDWSLLMNGVARTLDHQSQESTDCRWVSLLFRMTTHQLMVPPELARAFAEYPYFGDQRMVRPSIRAAEINFSNQLESTNNWATSFWNQCLTGTGCQILSGQSTASTSNVTISLVKIDEVADRLVQHYKSSLSTTGVDAKHDTIFGTAFYCLGILRELIGFGGTESILGRMGLRTILECYITLAYLLKKNDEALWKSYRVYGAGQGKLALLKITEFEDLNERPTYVSADTLKVLANEDQWQEFLPIDVGDWEKSDLRKRSEYAGVKDEYDRYYSWTSAFGHGNWGAVRSTVFTICFNPLHRLHRMPLARPRGLEYVVPDIIRLVDNILSFVESAYPNFNARLSESKADPVLS